MELINENKNNKEQGAIVVEATIALAVFIFAIFTLLSVVNICYIQSKIGSSLASSTKEISQYSFLYYKFGLDEFQSKIHDENEHARGTAESTISGVGTLMDAFSGAKNSVETGDFDNLMTSVKSGSGEVDSLITMYKDELKDPKAFILGMAKLAGEELGEAGKNKLGQLMAWSFMQKNLIESPSDNADSFLKRYKVEGGLGGLDFNGSSLMAYGQSNEIQMVVTYKINVVKLLGIDFHFTIRQCAKSSAWGNGVSQIRISEAKSGVTSVWDLESSAERGKIITAEEKKSFTYTSDKNGFDGFDQSKNRFTQVTSMYGDSYNSESNVKSKLSTTLNDMENKVGKLSEDVPVKDSSGKDTTVKSDSSTRTYHIILVVPENADKGEIEKIVNDWLKSQDDNITVEVKAGYGFPAEKKS